MKKVEVSFVCDDCGAKLPDRYVKENANGNKYFDFDWYNTVYDTLNQNLHTDISIEMHIKTHDGKKFEELCRNCRIKWLDKALNVLKGEQGDHYSPSSKMLIDAGELKRKMCDLCDKDYSDEPCEPFDCVFMRVIDETIRMNNLSTKRW